MEKKNQQKSYETDCHLLRVRFASLFIFLLNENAIFCLLLLLKMMVKDVFRQIRRIIFMMNEEIESKAK